MLKAWVLVLKCLWELRVGDGLRMGVVVGVGVGGTLSFYEVPPTVKR
jgi:hypothetical protein